MSDFQRVATFFATFIDTLKMYGQTETLLLLTYKLGDEFTARLSLAPPSRLCSL